MSAETEQQNQPYRVLARKYRPQNFDELVGQDALVRTLKNAIESGRVAHAFMLTGVRGIGKTTTARIIAKALNYKGPDGTAGPTTGKTDDCPLCQAISEDRHPDVLEIDAASHTGVDDIRNLLDGVRYAPSEARYKIYIIDEVHMLSKSAFNALLKTLEEPPPHVKFIFATTEIRKVPVTVLSRCQRFDLRRVDTATLSQHYKSICDQEKVEIETEALDMIARAADGSVRDGLSLLDRAIALSADQKISTQNIKDMLGLADRARTMDLLEQALNGKAKDALDIMSDLYNAGADPSIVMNDLLDLTHVLTRLKAVPDSETNMAPDEGIRAKDMAEKLSMPTLGKTWQILLKGMDEIQHAPNPQNTAEMVLIRLIYAANLPDPAKLIEQLKSAPAEKKTEFTAPVEASARPPSTPAYAQNYTPSKSSGQTAPAYTPETIPDTQPVAHIHTLGDVVSALDQAGEHLLSSQVYQFVRLVSLIHKDKLTNLDIQVMEEAPADLPQRLGKTLSTLNKRRWVVSISNNTPQQPSIAEQDKAEKDKEFEDVRNLPVIQEILKVFPNAELSEIIKA